jgi:hypothetical protein
MQRQEANWRGRRSPFTSAPQPEIFTRMIELIRTNDAVVISFVESLMRDAGIGCLVADQNMSILDGSLGILPRRVLVESDRADEARRILKDAGIANEIRQA